MICTSFESCLFMSRHLPLEVKSSRISSYLYVLNLLWESTRLHFSGQNRARRLMKILAVILICIILNQTDLLSYKIFDTHQLIYGIVMYFNCTSLISQICFDLPYYSPSNYHFFFCNKSIRHTSTVQDCNCSPSKLFCPPSKLLPKIAHPVNYVPITFWSR